MFADEYHIKFIGHKWNVVVFGMKGLEIMPGIYVKGELVPCVNGIVY